MSGDGGWTVGADGHLLVVGGGPAAQAAARAYREAGGAGRVTIVTDDSQPPYERPPLSKQYLRGDVAAGTLALAPLDWYADHRVGVRTSTAVASLDVARRVATLAGGEELGWDACVLATGSQPIRPPVPGGDSVHALVLRTAADARRIADRVGGPGGRVVVVGSGFIGCEAAASLAMRGADVVQVSPEAAPQATRLGPDAAARIAGWLEQLGVRRIRDELAAIEPGRRRAALVRLGGGETMEVDAVVLAVGVRPRIELAASAGLRLDGGGVAVDAAMRASAPCVLAAGDIAFAHHPAAGRPLRVEHWGDAIAHGESAGATAAGLERPWSAAPGFWSEIGDHTLKHAAWGDGFDTAELDADGDAFTVRYRRGDALVGILTHRRDDDYEAGADALAPSTPTP